MKTGNIIRALALVLLCGGLPLTVNAAEVSGVRIEEHVKAGNSELVLNGAGLRSKLFFKVYVAALYTTQKTMKAGDLLEASAPRRMTLHLLRDLDAETLLGALNDGLRANLNEAEQAALKNDSERFATLMRSVGNAKSGDIISIDFNTEGTAVSMNAQARGAVPGEAFGRALLRVWLGEHPAQADLKQALLGG